MVKKHLSFTEKSRIVDSYYRRPPSQRPKYKKWMAEHYNVKIQTIGNIINQHKARGTVARKEGTGKKNLNHIIGFVKNMLKTNGKLTLNQISAKLKRENGIIYSPSSVHRLLHKMKFEHLKPIIKPFISASSPIKRKIWFERYKRHKHDNIIYSDETAFSLYPDKLPSHWCTRETRPIVRQPGFSPKIHVWGCIQRGRNLLIRIYKPNMDSKKYIETLKICLLPILKEEKRKRRKITFQQDNARCHVSLATQDFFKANGINVMEWPPYSPDLNPIENIWHLMKQFIAKAGPTTVGQLRQEIINAANSISVNVINNLIDSMPRRMDKLRDANFDTIDY
jgi:transposase